MEVHNYKKGGILLYHLAFLVMLILLDSYCCGAAVLVKSNSSFPCDGRLEECLIEEDLELEFLMNPYVSRILANDGQKPQTENRNQPSFDPATCGKPEDDPKYKKCIDEHKQKGGGSSCKGSYCRP